MAFIDQFSVGDAPERKCPEQFGGLFTVFKPELLQGHALAGYQFRPNACLGVIAYDPDYCAPGDLKMDPGSYPATKAAVLGMIQTAINCTYGATMDELRDEVRSALADKIERAVEADFVAFLTANAGAPAAAVQAKCALADAAQFLSNNSECGRGLITGPIDWFVQLEDTLVWQAGKGYHTDFVGNIVIPHSVDNSTVYALDLAVDIKISEVLVMDETAPGIRNVNDRIVRAEQLYTIAVDSCGIGAFLVSACCPCAGGGGGGGGNVTVDNLCSCVQDINIVSQTGPPVNVTVTNLPPVPDPLPSTITVSSHHFDVVPGSPWTPAAIPAGRLTGVSYTVIEGLVDTADADGTTILSIPQGFTGEWQVQNDLETLTPPTSITAQVGGRSIVTMSVATP